MELMVVFGFLLIMLICLFLALKGIFDLSRIFYKIGFFFPLVWLFFTYVMGFKDDLTGSVLIIWYILGGLSIFFGIKKFIRLIISLFEPK